VTHQLGRDEEEVRTVLPRTAFPTGLQKKIPPPVAAFARRSRLKG
jgi:hypothetical protein